MTNAVINSLGLSLGLGLNPSTLLKGKLYFLKNEGFYRTLVLDPLKESFCQQTTIVLIINIRCKNSQFTISSAIFNVLAQHFCIIFAIFDLYCPPPPPFFERGSTSTLAGLWNIFMAKKDNNWAIFYSPVSKSAYKFLFLLRSLK